MSHCEKSANYVYWFEIQGYDGPVLIDHGSEDKIVRLDYSQQAQKVYANAELRVIQGGAPGFSKQHDAIALEYLRQFAGRNT